MQELVTGLYVGGLEDCGVEFPTVHACQECWEQKVRSDRDYLYVAKGDNLWLNMVDARTPKYFSQELFDRAIDFMDLHDPVFVHCSRGQSRSPSIALWWLSKRVYGFSSFQEGKKWLLERMPDYRPGTGISKYLTEHWSD